MQQAGQVDELDVLTSALSARSVHQLLSFALGRLPHSHMEATPPGCSDDPNDRASLNRHYFDDEYSWCYEGEVKCAGELKDANGKSLNRNERRRVARNERRLLRQQISMARMRFAAWLVSKRWLDQQLASCTLHPPHPLNIGELAGRQDIDQGASANDVYTMLIAYELWLSFDFSKHVRSWGLQIWQLMEIRVEEADAGNIRLCFRW